MAYRIVIGLTVNGQSYTAVQRQDCAMILSNESGGNGGTQGALGDSCPDWLPLPKLLSVCILFLIQDNLIINFNTRSLTAAEQLEDGAVLKNWKIHLNIFWQYRDSLAVWWGCVCTKQFTGRRDGLSLINEIRYDTCTRTQTSAHKHTNVKHTHTSNTVLNTTQRLMFPRLWLANGASDIQSITPRMSETLVKIVQSFVILRDIDIGPWSSHLCIFHGCGVTPPTHVLLRWVWKCD